jgi:Replication-relaxation
MIKNNRHRDESERIESHHPKRENAHDWIVLKQRRLRIPEISKYEHDTAVADVYVALHSLVDEWDIEVPIGDGLKADIGMVFRGEGFCLEVDLGNEKPEILYQKIERYVLYGEGRKVIFLLRDGKYKAGVVGTRLMDYCRERLLGNFVTATLLDNFLEFPLGDVLISPKDGRISISQLG